MKKHFSRALALLLALVMVLSAMPVIGFATEEGETATAVNGLPADGSYGVLYNVGNVVMGADVSGGGAPAKAVTVTTDGKTINSLPNGAAVIKFTKDGSNYIFQLGSQYLALNEKEELILTDSLSDLARWTFVADQAGAAGYYNIKNVGFLYNGNPVYLEVYNGSVKPWSYKASSASLYQFKVFSTSADEDGRVGEPLAPGDLPVNEGKYVVYCHYAKAVMGQPTGADVAAPALLPAAAVRNPDGSIDYENVADGGMIFTVHVSGTASNPVYAFENNGKYLAMPENTVDDNGKTNNAETLHLIDWPQEAEKQGYAQWTLVERTGGYEIKNKAAKYGNNYCSIEYFNEVFTGWTFKPDSPELFAMNFVPMEDREGTGYVVNPEVRITEPDPAIGSDCEVKFEIHDVSEPTQVTASFKVDNGAFQTVQHSLELRSGSFTVPAAELEGGKKLTVRVMVTDELGKSYDNALVVDIRDEPLILSAQPAANSATGDETRPEISVRFANVGEDPVFAMLVDDQAVSAQVEGDKLSYTPAEDMTEGKHSVSVTITRADGKSVNKSWSFFIGEGGETLYFGQIHAHTAEYSDGVGTLEDAYEHAQGVDDLDFIFITDHSNYFDTTSTAVTSSYYNLSGLLKNAAGDTTKWEEARATAKEYNERYDDFLCMYGYEMTWSGGPGHTNTFNTYGVVSRNNKDLNNKTGYAGMHLYNDLMVNADKGLDVEGNEAKTTRGGAEVTGVNATKYIPFDEAGNPVPVVSQFNHPGKTFGNFDNYAGYSAKRDDVLNLIEVGNGEGKVGGSAYFPSYSEYDLCLSMGWHVGPTNNQDNHKGNWGDSNTCRDVILTDDFSEIGVYRALDARRIYSTEDQNLRLFYELEAKGESFKLGDIAPFEEDDQPETVTVKVNVSDPDRSDKIATVEIIGEGGKTLKKVEVNANDYQEDLTIPNTDGYYYVRVVEEDGDIAVTAPVWVKEAIPVAADLETSVAVAAQGEEETVTASLTNGSESEPLTLTGYKIEAEGRILVEANDVYGVVEPGTDRIISWPFTPSVTDPATVKTYEIKVTFNVVFKEKELVYTKTITETSYPPEMMTYIGLDKGHDNFYVSGDYAGNEGNFIDICAQRGILCKYIDKGEMTKENLARFKAVLITVPRVKGDGLPAVWTAEELEALKDYADNGGTILSFSKSDRYDPDDPADAPYENYYSSANLSNLINEAIGAQTRFVRGIVVDNEQKANEAYRIYFDGRDLIGEHLFTEGIYPSSNGRYQWYNGTGIVTDPCLRFTDVDRSGWYHSGVDFALTYGIMNGTSTTTFSPEMELSRAQFVTILYAVAGRPSVAGLSNPFSDVAEDAWYRDPVLWAAEKGITSGIGGGLFGSDAPVTREQVAVFLYKYAKMMGLDTSARAELSAYPDLDKLSGWAVQQVSWAVAQGLISGVGADGVSYLSPEGTATRAMATLIFKKFIEGYKLELPKSDMAVVSLINPYDSTWVASYKANFTGSAYEPDYNKDVVMAEKGAFSLATAEKLPGGGWLVCSGATFISNYDLKYGDPANEQYENYLLVCNILDFIRDGEFDDEITPIAQVHQGEVGQEFTIEGWVTSNASDYDKDTAFFDCIYIQDETRGINAFPVSGYYFIGEKVRAHGGVTYYCGEIELNLSTDYNGSIKVISNDLNVLEPKAVTCAEAMSDDNIGNLMMITGKITDFHETAGVVDMIYVDDGSGEEAMLFINGYIQKESHALDGIEIGMNIEGVGIGSRDVDEASGGADGQIGDDIDPSLFIKRLRVRSRDELKIWADELDTTALEAAIAEAEGLDRSLYTEESLAALDEALAAAKAVMADPDKNQRTVTEACNALRAALDALEELPQVGFFGNRTEVVQGDRIVIYHPAQGKALSTTLSGNKVEGIAVTADHGELRPVDGVAIYTVEYPEGDTENFYLKMEDGRYLTTGPKGNSMSFEETPNDYSLWHLVVKDEDAGTVFVYSTNASYNGTDKNQALEYYNGYTTYGWKDNANYIFQIYVSLS